MPKVKQTKQEKLLQEKYNGIKPLCKCGCGQETRYEATKKDFCQWIHGHQAKVKGHFGDPKNPKRVEKIIKTRKEKFASGEYDHVVKAVKENRKDPELGSKISKGATGVPKPKPEGFGIGRIQSEETKQKMSESHIEYILKTGKVKRSNLEYKFEGILQTLNLNFIHSYYIKEIKKIYDFYLPEYNMLIEVDGDFWHCNPNTKFSIPECKTQEININNDKIKNQWAQDNNYKLLRFWEYDINNNIEEVITTLKKEVGK